jgi:hypothetical protein
VVRELLFRVAMRTAAPNTAIRKAGRRRLRRALVRLAGIALCVACAGGAHGQGPAGDALRAAEYLPGFIQYVRWPAEESIDAWQVCRLLPPGKASRPDGRTARGKPVAVRPIAAGDALAGCQILDLTDAPAPSVKALLAQARKQPILTIGDDAAFCTAGGVVCLRTGDGASGFEINLSAVQEAGLRVNAQLLNLGRKRETAKEGQ